MHRHELLLSVCKKGAILNKRKEKKTHLRLAWKQHIEFVLGLKMDLGQGLPLHPRAGMYSINTAQYADWDVMFLTLKVYEIL